VDEFLDVSERHATPDSPDSRAVERGVDLVADPHSEDDGGNIWTLLRRARNPSAPRLPLLTQGSRCPAAAHTSGAIRRLSLR
jgi:hypothetical protein